MRDPGMSLALGIVRDVYPMHRKAIVVPDKIGEPVMCELPSSYGTNQYGPKDISLFAAGTKVVFGVVGDDTPPVGVILTAICSEDDAEMITNSVAPPCNADSAGCTGPLTSGTLCIDSAAYRHPPSKSSIAPQLWNYKNNVQDAVAGSDAGALNELGVGYGLSRAYAWMRASYLAGITMFYMDNLVRLEAHNFEHWSAGFEKWHKLDNGRIGGAEFSTPYPWESAGAISEVTHAAAMPSSPARGIVSSANPGALKGFVAPVSPESQFMLPRLIKLSQYLGDIERTLVVLPKLSLEGKGVVNTLGKSTHIGLLDIHARSDGGYSVRSAKEITSEKCLLLPVPSLQNYPEGNGMPAVTIPDIGSMAEFIPSTKSPYLRTAQLYDYHAYLFNSYSNSNLLKRKPGTGVTASDWFIPDESLVLAAVGAAAVVPTTVVMDTYIPDATSTTGPLNAFFTAGLPMSIGLKIDHRYAVGAKYYASRSLIKQHDDGSITIAAGYGESITMSGGSIHMTAPGDVWLRPGRSLTTWAGDDIVMRAGSSVDVSAANGDVRLKADVNMHMLSGNSGLGSTLIENKAAPVPPVYEGLQGEDVIDSGITLKSTLASVSVHSETSLALTTGIGGPIVIDAGKGTGLICMVGSAVSRWVKGMFTDIAGVTPAEVAAGTGTIAEAATSIFSQGLTYFGSKALFMTDSPVVNLASVDGNCILRVDGAVMSRAAAVDTALIVGGMILNNGGLLTSGFVWGNSHLGPTPFTSHYALAVKPIVIPPRADAAEALIATNKPIILSKGATLTAAYNTLAYTPSVGLYAPDRQFMCFSFRSEAQYGAQYIPTTGGFKLPEEWWQHGTPTSTLCGVKKPWIEPVVVANGLPTMPCPGFVNWNTQLCYIKKPDVGNWNSALGTSNLLTGPIGTPGIPLPLAGNYMVTTQKLSI